MRYMHSPDNIDYVSSCRASCPIGPDGPISARESARCYGLSSRPRAAGNDTVISGDVRELATASAIVRQRPARQRPRGVEGGALA
jgi:hypothetical protein